MSKMARKTIPIGVVLIIFAHLSCFAQLITISGKISDKETGNPLPGATVKTGAYGTSTNTTGQFYLIVDETIVKQYGISVSFVGYQQLHITYKGNEYKLYLSPLPGKLKEVVISVKGETVLAKAIRKIPENYPDKDFIQQGSVRMIHTAADSLAPHYFYKNDAVVRAFYTSYKQTTSAKLLLVRKTDTLVADPKSEAGLIRWVNGYYAFTNRDYVHNRSGMLADNHLKNFNYVMNGKDWVNGHRVFVINFYSKTKREDAGTLYVDTATYAFVRITNTVYNVKSFIFIPTDKAATTVDYKRIDNKWYLYTVKVNNLSRHKALNLTRADEYQATGIDTADVKPFAYQDIIGSFTEDLKVSPLNDTLTSLRKPSYFTPVKIDTAFAKIEVPVIDTETAKFKNGINIYRAYVNYIFNDNIRSLIQLSASPVKADGYQEVVGKTIAPISNYTIGLNLQLRLYLGLFFEIDGQSNYGIGGIKNNEEGYYLTYNFRLNKKGHPFTLSPIMGRANIKLTNGKTEYYNQSSWVSGLNLSYDMSYRWSVFFGGKYYSSLNTESNIPLTVTVNNFTMNGGLFYKLKF
jgi:hypothetical protein